MADSYYQIATTPKLYVSYPLYQYASGALDEYSSLAGGTNGEGFINDSDMIKLLQIDPSNQLSITTTRNWIKLFYKLVPSYDNETLMVDSGLWNYDFYMILGHNFASKGVKITMKTNNNESNISHNITTTNIVNSCESDFPEYDGWSLGSITSNAGADNGCREMQISIQTDTGLDFDDVKMGSLLFGKSFEFPINTSLSTTTKFEYGIKQKSTISGKTISTANWTKPNNWITEPFGLGNQEGDNYQRRSGRRVWKMQFDSLAPDKVMNQNMMMNSNGFTAQDNHSTAADSVESLYNINDATDFYTNVVHRSMSSHLPMVLQIDKNNNSADQFAIVRLNPNYTIKQKSPNLYSISVTLTEQI